MPSRSHSSPSSARGLRNWLLATTAILATAGTAHALDPGLRCELTVAAQLRSCLRLTNLATRRCYETTGAACAEDNTLVATALDRLAQRVSSRCPDDATAQAAGYGAAMTRAGLLARLREACVGEAASLAARSFGGPQASQLNTLTGKNRDCLLDAQREGAGLMLKLSKLRSACIGHSRRGGACNVASIEDRIASVKAKSEQRLGRLCPLGLENLVGAPIATFVARTDSQTRCQAAVAHPNTAPLDLDCGPRAQVPVPARGTDVQIVLPESEWGTRCGDGSSYAFWVHLAPEGSPIENVLVFMQGGGVCVLEDDCAGVSAGLLKATDNTMPVGGFLSSTSATNPFRDWTKVYLPYCTQDLHIGGGTTSNFPSRTVHRFGAVNVRTALNYVRDILWNQMDAESVDGYRPDRLRVLLSGGSAGGFGTSYNYHYALDDLRWTHTTAAPDSSLGLDSNQLFSIRTLGGFMTSEVAPLGWGSRPFLPPYCYFSTCAVIPTLHAAHAQRLKAVPEQQLINVSNQVDNTQVGTTYFPSTVSWINAMRNQYCASQGMNGIFSFLPASNSSIHGILDASRFDTLTVDGVVARDFLADAMSSPDTIQDRVESGTVAATFGAINFPCSVD